MSNRFQAIMKTKVLLIIFISAAILGSLQIWITFDCMSKEGESRLLNCTLTNGNLSISQDEPKLFIQSKDSTSLVYVEIADEPNERNQGLMFRENLEWDRGMFFVFDDERILSFWMKNTLIPLDMLFIDADFRIVDIKENVPPCKDDPCPSYSSEHPAKYVLEVNSGFVLENNIKIDDTISFEPQM